MKIDDVIEIEIIAYDHEGIGIGKIDGCPVFIKNTIVGEIVEAKINYVGKKLMIADLVRIIKVSENRNQNPCRYYLRCGGCNIFHMNYSEQLKFKKQMVIDTLYKVAGIKTEVMDVVANPNPYNYRNKIIVPLGFENDEIVSGFYEAETHKIVAQDECLIENKFASIILKRVKELLKKYNISIYNEEMHQGLARNVMLRVNNKNEFMLILIVKENRKVFRSLLEEIANEFVEIKSIYLNINDKKTNVILNQDGFIHMFKDKTIIEEINGLLFEVHPNSFLQVNYLQAKALYNKALEYVTDGKSQTIIDAYCGIGSITLNLAKKAKEVYGIEVVKEAVINANRNKELNNINNAHFICGKCEDEILKLKKLNVDTIVFDPPRKGCDERFLNTVIEMNVNHIIYISCLTQTFARDARYLLDHGYELVRVHPFDLFSQTSHTENLGYFEKIKKM